MSAPSHLLSRVVGMLMVTMFADLDSRTPLPRIALFRAATGEWVYDSDASAPRPPLEDEVPQAAWMCVMANAVFPIEATTVPELLVELVTQLQWWVMRVTGQEWPEVYTPDGFAGLARPAIGSDGLVGWSVLGAEPVPFGSLTAKVSGASGASSATEAPRVSLEPALPVVHRTVA